jgi:hypothetical protein
VTSHDRIRRAAQAVADLVGTHNHLRYLEVVAVVLYADECANNLEEWEALMDPEFITAATEGAEALRDKLEANRIKRAA